MQEAHLSYEELEKYMDESDLSEAYLCWSEQVTEHLDVCEHCRKRLDKLFLLSELWKEDNIAASVRLVGREETIKRKIIALRLELMAENRRMLEVARQLRLGALLTMYTTKAEILRGRSVARGEESAERTVQVSYNDGVLSVMVGLSKPADVVVVLTQPDKTDAPPWVEMARWQEEEQLAIAEFEVGELAENYEIYVEV